MATKSKDVTTTETFFGLEKPAYINDNSARGSEEVRTEDLILPRLEIVQALSPIKETTDAREGMLFNSVTQEVIGDVAYMVNVYFKVEHLVWKRQDQGGGFFGSFASAAEAENRRQEVIESGEDPESIEIIDTPVHYGMRITPDGKVCEQIVVSMSKTKAKVSRKWNAQIQLAGGDRFSRVYKLTSFVDQNKKGQRFHNWVVQGAGFTPEPIYHKAEALYEVFKQQGGAKVAHESVVDVESASEETEARGGI